MRVSSGMSRTNASVNVEFDTDAMMRDARCHIPGEYASLPDVLDELKNSKNRKTRKRT
jgi:hypothetical protein